MLVLVCVPTELCLFSNSRCLEFQCGPEGCSVVVVLLHPRLSLFQGGIGGPGLQKKVRCCESPARDAPPRAGVFVEGFVWGAEGAPARDDMSHMGVWNAKEKRWVFKDKGC